MIQFVMLASPVMKAKEVRRVCKELQEIARTDGTKEFDEWDEWIKNCIEVNRPYLDKKEKAANATTLTA